MTAGLNNWDVSSSVAATAAVGAAAMAAIKSESANACINACISTAAAATSVSITAVKTSSENATSLIAQDIEPFISQKAATFINTSNNNNFNTSTVSNNNNNNNNNNNEVPTTTTHSKRVHKSGRNHAGAKYLASQYTQSKFSTNSFSFLIKDFFSKLIHFFFKPREYRKLSAYVFRCRLSCSIFIISLFTLISTNGTLSSSLPLLLF